MMFKENLYKIRNLNFDLIFFINLSFCIFPLTYILGNLLLNLNLLILCLLGIIYLKKKLFYFKPDLFITSIILFFFLIFFSTLINSKILNHEEFEIKKLENLFKSIIFLRFLLLLIIIYLLSKYDVINFRYFFYSAAFFSTALALDVIYQYVLGRDIFGFESGLNRNSGFFGNDEPIAGGYIERFAFFTFFLVFFLTIKKKSKNLFFTSLIIYVLLVGAMLAGNRMPLVLLLTGLVMIFIFIHEFRKPIISAFVIFLITFAVVANNNTYMKSNYLSFYGFQKSLVLNIYKNFTKVKKIDKKNNLSEEELKEKSLDNVIHSQFKFLPRRNIHAALFLTAIDTWKMNKIFGNGIKSFRKDCLLIIKSRYKYKGDYQKLIRVNRACSNHPHNYYLEILTETGIVGLCFIILFFLILLITTLKYLLKNKKKNFDEKNLILLAALISLLLELFPMKSSGSFFSTQNATYITIILSIIMSYKKSKSVS